MESGARLCSDAVFFRAICPRSAEGISSINFPSAFFHCPNPGDSDDDDDDDDNEDEDVNDDDDAVDDCANVDADMISPPLETGVMFSG